MLLKLTSPGIFLFNIYLFLFLAVLGLGWGAQASLCGGLSLSQSMGLIALRHV